MRATFPRGRIGTITRLAIALVLACTPAAVTAPAGADPHRTGPRAGERSEAPRLHGPEVSRSDERPTSGLDVTIETLTPAYLTGRQPVEVSGTITNLDDFRWTDVQVYLAISQTPMTTSEQLQADADSDPLTYIGDRITAPGTFDEVGDLEPGASVGYSFRVPYDQLGISTAQGVYSMAVHAIGANREGIRPQEAPGRVRTFMPQMARRPETTVDVSTLWPLGSSTLREPDGTYDTETLLTETGPNGRLGRLVDLLRSAGDVPTSVIVDPALLDALDAIANGAVGPPEDRPPSPDDEPTDDGADGGEAAATVDPEARSRAADDLADLLDTMRETEIFTHPYARADLEAMVRNDRLQREVRRATTASLLAHNLSGVTAYWPMSGLAAPQDLAAVQHDHGRPVAILSAEALESWSELDGPVQRIPTEDSTVRTLVVDDAALDGAPAPGVTDTALQVRQRLLAETALLSLQAAYLGRDSAATVFAAGPGWDPGPSWLGADFFAAFEAPWLEPTLLGAQLADRAPLYRGRVAEVDEQEGGARTFPLGGEAMKQALRLSRRATTLESLVLSGPATTTYYSQAVAIATSQWWRGDPAGREDYTDDVVATIGETLNQVTVESPGFVTLSSRSGRFPLAIINELDREVRVGLSVSSDDGSLEIARIEPVPVGPGQTTNVFVETTKVSGVGVVAVTARLTTADGQPFGRPAKFSLRTSVVGVVIWVLLGAAGALFVLAVVRRLVKRARRPAEETG